MIRSAPPLVELAAVVKQHGSAPPLRVQQLTLAASDRVAISGLDAAAAETLLHLITGAAVPDEGTVRVAGRDTRHIATDTEWLTSLDRFGIVTARAVLIGAMPIAANLALPITLSVDPMARETRTLVERLAGIVGLPRARLDAAASTLTPAELVRVHLARALAPKPQMLLLEHPTSAIDDPGLSRDIGAALRRAGHGSDLGWLAVTDDADFARAADARRLRLRPATGQIVADTFWRRW
jgi:predicted ABC-type transport system involved in lysophospholipase L1 biosynthesis ATPase subunit